MTVNVSIRDTRDTSVLLCAKQLLAAALAGSSPGTPGESVAPAKPRKRRRRKPAGKSGNKSDHA